MTDETIAVLLRCAIGITLAASVVLVLRLPAQRLLGAEVAYRLWLALPLALAAAAWPKPAVVAASPEATAVVALAGTAATAPLAAAALPAPADLALWAWLAGALVAALLLGLRQRRALRGLVGPSADGSYRHAGDLGPALVGAWRPRLVLPVDFESRYAPAEQRLILLHEDVHRARHDGAWNLLAALLLCLNWFNPVLHLAHARFRRDQELACDAAVLRLAPGSAKRYALAMLKAAGLARWLPVGCHWPRRHALVERVAALATHGRAGAARPVRTVLVATLVLAVAATAHAVQPAPLELPDATPADAQSPAYYRIEGTLLRNGQPAGQPAIVVSAGQPGSIEVDGVDGFRIALVASADRDGRSVLTASIADSATGGRKTERRFAFDRHLDDAEMSVPAESGRPALQYRFRAEALTEAEWRAAKQAMLRAETASSQRDATLLDAPTPLFPPELVTAGHDGTVLLRVHVQADGRVADVEVERVSDQPGAPAAAAHARYTSAAIDAVRGWRFNAARDASGAAASSWVLVPIRFESRPEGAEPAPSPRHGDAASRTSLATPREGAATALATAADGTAITEPPKARAPGSVISHRYLAAHSDAFDASDPVRANATSEPAGSAPAGAPNPALGAAGLSPPPRVLHKTLASPRAGAIRFSAEDIAEQRALEVHLELAIDDAGRLAAVTVLDDVPPAAADAARRWVKDWRYAAARDGAGRRVAGTLVVTARFQPPPRFIARFGGLSPARD